MNFKFYSVALCAAAMMASCTSEEPAGASAVAENGQGGYAAVNIALPSAPLSRAGEVSYDNGTEAEWAVKNAKLLLFRAAGSDENAYTFVEASDLRGYSFVASTGEVTATSAAVGKFSKVSVSETYYACVLLNAPASLVLPATGETYGQWSNKVQNLGDVNINNGLLMANAPLLVSGKPVALAQFNGSAIKSTQEAALANPATTVYVERAVSKVAVSTQANYAVAGTSDNVVINAWALDVTNKTTYAVRNYANTGWDNKIWTVARFFAGELTNKRLHWSVDPNYNASITTEAQVEAAFNVVKDPTKVTNTSATAAYCWENTFDIAHMLQGQTTRVLLKATYTPACVASETSKTFYRLGAQAPIYTQSTLEAAIKGRAVSALGTSNVTVSIEGSKIKTEAGRHAISVATIKVNGADATAAQITAIEKQLGLDEGEGILTYLEGATYYVARVKHFGDALTPWTLGNATYGAINDENNTKYLGRYSVVRNNSYVVNVTKVSNPGYPVIPEIPIDTPDDESDFYIAVTVNVLPWAVRVHDTIL